MKAKNLLIFLFIFLGITGFSQDTDSTKIKKRTSRISLGVGLNIPMQPNSATHDLGMSVSEQYEFLLWEHLSLMQSLSYNFISGKSVEEFYENQNIIVQYENFHTVPFQLGIGWYFGEDQSKFYIYFKGGIAYYWGVSPAKPEIVVNGNTVVPEIPREEFDGTFSFFTPAIGWKFKRASFEASYQGTINVDTKLNVLNLTLRYRIY